MPMSDYLKQIRSKVGNDLLVLPSAAVVIHDDQGRVLAGLHADHNIWVAPGGLIEPGELPADAAVREVWEETGLLVELTGVFGVFGGSELLVHYANGDRVSYIGTIFRGRVQGGSLRPDGQEVLELKYFSETELAAVRHARWMDLAWKALFSKDGAAQFQPPRWQP